MLLYAVPGRDSLVCGVRQHTQHSGVNMSVYISAVDIEVLTGLAERLISHCVESAIVCVCVWN